MGDSSDTDSCSSRAVPAWIASPPKQPQIPRQISKHHSKKIDTFNDVLRRLRTLRLPETEDSAFEDDLWAHFDRLSLGYAIEINLDKVENVLMHKRILEEARNPAATRPAIEVQLCQFPPSSSNKRGHSVYPNFAGKESIHLGPAFATSPDCKILQDMSNPPQNRLMLEITISTTDKKGFFTKLTNLLSEIDLNIHEAHAFSTTDGYCLDVFCVEHLTNTEAKEKELKNALIAEMSKLEKYPWLKDHVKPQLAKLEYSMKKSVVVPDWEIDASLLAFESKLASGANSDLYKGIFCGQDVAVKVIRPEYQNKNNQDEFAQEINIMRNLHHDNIVQFIGACTKAPNLCIVTEYVSGGSLFDILRKQKGGLDLQHLLAVAIHVSKGMSYLHQKSIIHRDLKAANILLNENGVVKVADFGVARVTRPGVMTAETGTYRWMAPEVIEHRPYDHKADVFSFGILLWELLTGKVPYENLTPLQAAVGVVQKGLRPEIPNGTHPKLVYLIQKCWQREPSPRPEFSEIQQFLQDLVRSL